MRTQILTFTTLLFLTACQQSDDMFSQYTVPTDRCGQLIESVGAVDAYEVCVNDAQSNVPEAQFALAKAFESGALGLENKSYAAFWYKKAAANEYLPAELYLAQYYLRRNKSKQAVKLLENIAKTGNVESQVILGKLYFQGIQVEKNLKRAKVWFEKAAHAENAQAQYYLSQLYLISGFRDEEKSNFWLQSAAALNQSDAIESIAEKFIGEENYETAGKWLAKGSKMGSHPSQYLLAKIILEKKVSWNIDVIALLQRSQTYIPSKILLAKCYLNGTMIPQDVSKAKSLLLEAAKAGSPEADYEIGLSLLRGYQGWQKDIELGIDYIKRSASRDYKPANVILATLFIEGKPLMSNKREALTHLALMAIDGKADAQYKLAILLKDFGIPVYDRVAFYWLEKAAATNYLEAKYLLAQFYQEGIGTEIDYDKSFVLYQKVASKNYPNAFLALARFYHYGWGTEANAFKAKQWLTLAVEAKVPDSKQVAKEIFESNHNASFDANTPNQLLDFAVESDVPSALYTQGKRYFDGTNGYLRNLDKGFAMIQNAANQSYLLAQRELGIIFEHGLYGNGDINKARQWYQKAALQGDEFSQFRLAQIYFSDHSIEDNAVQAYAWANLAAATGMLPAEDFRDMIFESLTPTEVEQGQTLSLQILSKYQDNHELKTYNAQLPAMPFEVENAIYH